MVTQKCKVNRTQIKASPLMKENLDVEKLLFSDEKMISPESSKSHFIGKDEHKKKHSNKTSPALVN